jgi:tetratricopeptide (TPR) repeat protein
MADFFHQRITSLEERLSKEPQSPLFARLASHYLQAGRAEDALRLCDEGLSHYPFYSTAHLIKGKALVELKMMAEAKREFQVVHELLPNNEAVARLQASIDLGPSAGIGAAVAEEVAAGTAAPLVETAPPEEEAAIAGPPAAAQEKTPPHEALAEEQPAAPPEARDFAFGAPVEAAPPVEQPPEEVPSSPAEPQAEFEAGQGEEQPMAEASAEEPLAPAEEVSATEAPGGETRQPPSWQEAFSQLDQPAQGVEEPAVSEQTQEENPFAAFGAEAPAAEGILEEEAFDAFAARKRMEYFGSEDTLALDDYLGSGSTAASPAEDANGIEDIAEKLKTPKKITPVINFTDKAPRPASEADTPASTGFVTPTLAEIYVKQGWYDDAIKAYRTLAANKPGEREKFEQRIAEIEEMKKQQG